MTINCSVMKSPFGRLSFKGTFVSIGDRVKRSYEERVKKRPRRDLPILVYRLRRIIPSRPVGRRSDTLVSYGDSIYHPHVSVNTRIIRHKCDRKCRIIFFGMKGHRSNEMSSESGSRLMPLNTAESAG